MESEKGGDHAARHGVTFDEAKSVFCDQNAPVIADPKSPAPPSGVSCLAVPPWRSKKRSMNGIPREVSFRAVFAPVEPHAVVTGQMPHAT